MAYVSDPIGLCDSIKSLILSNVVAEQTTSISAGNDKLELQSTCGYSDGDYALIYSSAETDTAAYEVQCMPRSSTTLWVSPAIPVDIASATVIKRVGGQYLRPGSIHVGNPPATYDFPMVLIDASILDDSPFTLGGVSKTTYGVTISIFDHAPTYQEAHRSCWAFAKQIEHALTCQVNPDPTRCIFNWKLGPIAQDEQVNASSTTKAIHMHIQYEEAIQRLATETPIIEMMASPGSLPDASSTRVVTQSTTVSQYPSQTLVSQETTTTVKQYEIRDGVLRTI